MNEPAAVRDLQVMLNQLALRNPALPQVAVTGIFDELTLEAVMTFQRDYPLPVTGVVDGVTWDAIVAAYREDQRFYGLPLELRVLPDGEYRSPSGSLDSPRIIAEAIFASLPPVITNFKIPADEKLFVLQRLADIPADGALNRITWDALARLYHLYVVRRALEHLDL